MTCIVSALALCENGSTLFVQNTSPNIGDRGC